MSMQSQSTTPHSTDNLDALCDRIATRLEGSAGVALDMSKLSSELFVSLEDVVAAAEYGVRVGRFIRDNSQIAKLPEFSPEEEWSQCIRLPDRS